MTEQPNESKQNDGKIESLRFLKEAGRETLEEVASLFVRQADYADLKKVVLYEVKEEFADWARRRATMLALLVAVAGLLGVTASGYIYADLMLRDDIRELVKEKEQAVIATEQARNAADSTRESLKLLDERLAEARLRAAEVEKSLSDFDESLDFLKARIESENEYFKRLLEGENKLLQDEIDRLTEALAKISEEGERVQEQIVSMRHKSSPNSAQMVANGKVSLRVLRGGSLTASQAIEHLRNAGFRVPVLELGTEAVGDNAVVVFGKGHEDVGRRILQELEKANVYSTIQFKNEPYESSTFEYETQDVDVLILLP